MEVHAQGVRHLLDIEDFMKRLTYVLGIFMVGLGLWSLQSVKGLEPLELDDDTECDCTDKCC
jgi:hypothetical protein